METQTSPDRLFWVFVVLLLFVVTFASIQIAHYMMKDGEPVAIRNEDNPAPQWPEGSMQWAENQAKLHGLPYARRRVWNQRQRTRPQFDFYGLTYEDRHALDWEPCR